MFTLKKTHLLTPIAAGLSLGVISFFSPGSLFCILIVLLIGLSIGLVSDCDERVFLTRLFFWGISSRVFLVLLTQFIFLWLQKWTYYEGGDRAIVLFGDDGFNTVVGNWIAQYVSGKHLSTHMLATVSPAEPFKEYGRTIYLYLVALFYYLFGYSPISIIFLNSIIGVSTGIVYFSLAKKIASIKVAKMTSIFVTFFPSLFTWSIINLKDSLLIFLTGVIIWLFLKFLDSRKIRFIAFLFLTLFFQFYLRQWILLPTIITLSLSYIIIRKKLKVRHVCLLIVVFIIICPFWKGKLNDYKSRIVDYHRGVVSSGGFVYNLYDDWLYLPSSSSSSVGFLGMLKAFLRGWTHFFLEPFPYKLFSKLSLVALPQMIFWYCLIPFSIFGALVQLRLYWNKCLVLIIYLLTIGSIFSLTGGNIGTDFRMRDILTPIMLLFSSVGLTRVFCSKSRKIV